MYNAKQIKELIKLGQDTIKKYKEDTTISKEYKENIIMLHEMRVATLNEVLTSGIQVSDSFDHYMTI
jgi:biotin synthase-like enzyme